MKSENHLKVERYYESVEEEHRMTKDRAHMVEFWTGMHYEDMKLKIENKNATNLVGIEDDTFDMTLELGPMYHFYQRTIF